MWYIITIVIITIYVVNIDIVSSSRLFDGIHVQVLFFSFVYIFIFIINFFVLWQKIRKRKRKKRKSSVREFHEKKKRIEKKSRSRTVQKVKSSSAHPSGRGEQPLSMDLELPFASWMVRQTLGTIFPRPVQPLFIGLNSLTTELAMADNPAWSSRSLPFSSRWAWSMMLPAWDLPSRSYTAVEAVKWDCIPFQTPTAFLSVVRARRNHMVCCCPSSPIAVCSNDPPNLLASSFIPVGQ